MSERVLPAGWVETTLGELNTHVSRSFDPKKNPDVACELYSVPVFFDGQPEKVEGKEIGSTKQHVEPRDVLICKINPRINRVWEVRENRVRLQIASSEWIVVRQEYFDSRYLRHYFQSPGFRAMLCSDVSGVGGSLTRAKPKLVAGYSVPVCSLSEQKAIADKLDELLTQVSNLKARLDAIPAILKRFRQSVIAAAVSGKLTEEWRGDSDMPFPYPRKILGDIILEMRNGLSPKPNEDARGDPILRISSVRPFSVDQHDIRFLEVGEKEKGRYSLVVGDLVFTRYNGSAEFVGVCGRIDELHHGILLYPDKLIRVRVDGEKLTSRYLELFSASFPARSYVQSLIKSTSGQKGISGKDLKEMVIVLPCLDEQIEIVRRVDQLFAFADQVEQQVKNAQARANKMTQSILAKAFRGELTAEWRAENSELISGEHSAAALLERIKAEKAKQKPAGRGRKKPAAKAAGSSSFS